MNDLLFYIKNLVEQEYERASEIHGKTNNSSHESYAIILEEYEEAKDCAKTFKAVFKDYWKHVKHNTSYNDLIAHLQKYAVRAAAEWVQVAAMCQKAQYKKQEGSGDE